ncbi:MAG: LLM class flavin-dependent oxidoreductase [Candidatus Tectomicrobia bacterium]|uniref:LLM class flavin-dependent oxidoreductase n=1 Tax=Tectimicrobiota bacterium TaxID=2528274 RepID=A0A937VYP7_UNCTE|nr:LLM class flavin-dependent oxidoreductase [Candidatus Tectomicrobia bacterium]
MTVSFGLRVPTAGTPQDTAEYAARVEGAGFDFMWMPDTPLLAGRWRDVYGHLTCAAMTTNTLRLGPGVTNPLTRHPVTTASAILTLDEASNGRADLVAGTGYSSAYIIGRKAATLATMRQAMLLWRSIFAGQTTQLGGLEIALHPSRPRLPLYLAATGPKMLEMAGEIADGVLIHVGAAPGAVAWALERIAAGEQRAGRQPHTVRRILVVHAMIDDNTARAIDHMRPCAAGYYRHGHARDLLRLAGLPEPPEVTGTFPRPYPDLGHAVDWDEAQRASTFVSDAAVEAMVCVGSGAAVADRVRALAALDIDAIWWRDEASYTRPDALLRGVEKEVLPRLR